MKKYVTGIAAVLACLGLGGLLSGFAPGPAPLPPLKSHWRGELVHNRPFSRIPLPDAEADFARQAAPTQRIRAREVPEIAARDEGGTQPASALFSFAGDGVSILTALGPRPVERRVEIVGPNSLDTGQLHPSEEFSRPLDSSDGFGPVELASRLQLRADLNQFMGKGPMRAVSPEPAYSLAEAHQPLVLRVTRYQEMVERYADKYGLSVPLVLAIIQAESGFNPNLISSRNAHGLMQVVPATAGGEVHRWLGRSGQPSAADLLNPDTNIRYGMVYMHLLQDKHLEGVSNPQSLEYCMIASYNGGSGAVLRMFGPSKEEAVAAINKLGPQEVLERLIGQFPARETRNYMRKVLSFRRQYVMLAAGEASPPLAPVPEEPEARPGVKPLPSSEIAQIRPSA